MATPPLDGTVLVTGASAGIGTELARLFAARAKKLVLVARRTERLEALKKELVGKRPELTVFVEPCDLSDIDATRAMLERVKQSAGEIDVLVNNAGFGDSGLFEKSDWKRIDQMVRLNILALTYLTHALVPGMVARGRGGVLNISSGFGLQFAAGFAVYVGTKHYVTGFTESLRAEVNDRGVVVTQACPGPVESEFAEVAGVKGDELPAGLMIKADQCAREVVLGFERGRPLVVPGFLMRFALFMGSRAPRWLLRLGQRRPARMLRARNDAA
jgi:short-subunit dehydrogenase